MNQRWESRRVRTFEDVFNEINNEMTPPVAIILIGANCDFKHGVYLECIKHEHLPDLAVIDTSQTPLEQAKKSLNEHRHVLIMLDFICASSMPLRRKAIKTLRLDGAKTVVTILAKPTKIMGACPAHHAYYDDLAVQQDVAIMQSKPDADEVDCQFIVTEKDEW